MNIINLGSCNDFPLKCISGRKSKCLSSNHTQSHNFIKTPKIIKTKNTSNSIIKQQETRIDPYFPTELVKKGYYPRIHCNKPQFTISNHLVQQPFPNSNSKRTLRKKHVRKQNFALNTPLLRCLQQIDNSQLRIANDRIQQGKCFWQQKNKFKNICIIERVEYANINNLAQYYTKIGGINYGIYDSYMTLQEVINEFGAFKKKLVYSMGYQLIIQLKYMHNDGIYHNNINPSTILYSNGNVYINIVKMSTKVQKSQEYYHYYSPQLYQGRIYNSQKNDIWSLGCIILKMYLNLHLQTSYLHPYNYLYKQKVSVNKLNYNYNPLQKQSKQIISFIQSCLNILPQLRPHINQLQQHPFVIKHNKSSKSPEKNYPIMPLTQPIDQIFQKKIFSNTLQKKIKSNQKIIYEPKNMVISHKLTY